jgi:hypothetical protein
MEFQMFAGTLEQHAARKLAEEETRARKEVLQDQIWDTVLMVEAFD